MLAQFAGGHLMIAAAFKVAAASAGMLLASVTQVFSFGAAALVLGGIFTVGTLKSIAWAWKEEKDAAVAKAERLADAVALADAERIELRTRVELLEKQTNFDSFARGNSKEHREIVTALEALTKREMQTATAVEFIARQTFPTLLPGHDEEVPS